MTKSLKRLLAAFLVTASCGIAQATVYNTVIVNLNDGSQTSIFITEDLKLSFTDTQLVATGSTEDIAIDRSQIVHFEHAYDETGAVDAINGASGMAFNGNSMTFSNLPQGSMIRVFTTAGILVSEQPAAGEYTLSLDGLAPGNYIVSVNNMSYKINKR